MSNDLQGYARLLIRRWRLVSATTILAALAAVAVSAAIPPTFEATAMIALAPATLSVPTANQVPPYYLTVDSPNRLPTAYTPAYYVAFLKSADIASAVTPNAAVSIAPNGADKSLIEITAWSGDAQTALQTANKWAAVGTARIQQLLVPNPEGMAAAQKKLDAADQALVRFSQGNGLGDYDPVKLRSVAGLTTEKRLELARLLRERDTAESVYADLAQDYERAAIVMTNAFKPSVMPAAAASSSGTKLVQNLSLAVVAGLVIGIVGAFSAEWLALG